MKSLINKWVDRLRPVRQWSSTCTRKAITTVRRLWRRHVQLMRDNAAYAKAILEAVLKIARQVEVGRLAIAMLEAIVAVYTALHPGPDPGTPFDYPPPWNPSY